MYTEIIPAIDILNGNCVRLKQGDYNDKTIYYKNPIDAAKMFMDKGLSRIHIVDLDGAKTSSTVNLSIVEKIASLGGVIEFGGGIKSKESLNSAYNAGVTFPIIGSMAITQPDMFIDILSDNIILGIDIKNDNPVIDGWTKTSDTTYDYILNKFIPHGLKHIICTDVTKDGMLSGPNIELYTSLISKYDNLNIIASGGVNSREDLHELFKIGIKHAVVGKAIYEQKIIL